MFPSPDQEFAWAIGLFEGEGSAGVYGNGKNKHVIAQVKMRLIDKDTVERFHIAVGVGRLQNENHAAKNTIMYGWTLTRQADLLMLAQKMYPYLSKRRQAQLDPVIEFCKLRLETPSRSRSRWNKFYHTEGKV